MTSARTPEVIEPDSIDQGTNGFLDASAACNRESDTSSVYSADSPKEVNDDEIETYHMGAPDFNRYSWSPRKPFGNKLATVREVSNGYAIDHRARLSDSLSDNHILDEPLVPSPLRIKTSRSPLAEVSNSTQRPRPLPVLPIKTLCSPTSGVEKSTPRLLPQLPFNHKPSIFQHGQSRLLQCPTINTTTPQTLKEGASSTDRATPSSFTPRFDFIYDVFEPQPSPLQPDGRTPSAHIIPAVQDLPLTEQDEFLSHVADLHRRIQTYHTPLIDEQISTTIQTQAEHEERKRQQGTSRVASYWLLRPVSPTSRVVPEVASTRKRQLKRPLQYNAETLEQDETDEQQTITRKERVANLKASGWNVRKERHGFKGEEYYQNLEREVLAELVNT